MSKQLPISIVIPCADDIRIKSCLESVDENVEVVVVLNGASQQVRNIIKNFPVRRVVTVERNIPKALNLGIERSKYDKVLIMDSDCVFRKGAVKLLCEALEKHYLVRGRLIYRSHDLPSDIIARARDYTNADRVKAYTPLLGLKKGVKRFINNYYFDSDIHWAQDADLDLRVRNSGITINYVPEAIAYHTALRMSEDLRSAFRYGIGKRIRVGKGIARGIGNYFSRTGDIILKKGFLAGLYMILWSFIYTAGYYYQLIRNPYGIQ